MSKMSKMEVLYGILIMVSSIAMTPLMTIIMHLQALQEVPKMGLLDGTMVALIHFGMIAFMSTMIWMSLYWLLGVACIAIIVHGFQEIKNDFGGG
jgi:hypothetical protein